MIKHFFVLAIIVCGVSFKVYAFDDVSISADSAVLMVQQTGEVLFAKNEHVKRGVASTTKIMTALLTLESATPDKTVFITNEMTAVEGTSMGLLPGDVVTYLDLVYGMLLSSGNDAANSAAISVSGSLDEFSTLMNSRAKELGMFNTNFVTPSGLDSQEHYSTAYDMALLGCAAINNPDFLSVCSTQRAELCYGKDHSVRYLKNHNRLLKEVDGAVGIKTGFTKKSGRCLVSAAEKNGVTLVCVTLNAPDDWNDHKKLLEKGFDLVYTKAINVPLIQTDVFGGNKNEINIIPDSLNNFICVSNESEYQTRIFTKPYLVAPVNAGDVVGEVRIMQGERIIKIINLVAGADVYAVTKEKKSGNILSELYFRLKKLFDNFREN